MNLRLSIAFAKFAAPAKGVVFVLPGESGALGDAARACDPAGTLPRAFAVAGFSGKFAGVVDVLAPEGVVFDRLVAVGTGEASSLDEYAWLKLGGAIAACLRKAGEATIVLDVPGVCAGAAQAAGLAAGLLLRSYSFDKYKKTHKDDANGDAGAKKPVKVVIQCAEPAKARKAFADAEAVVAGVFLARDLVNEPANVLGPVEFAERAKALEALGVKVEILAEKEMKKLGMGSLLGVAQGSPRGARMAVMQWSGGKAKDKPVAFVGKGVTFDTGGNSMKSASGMEDMKGDMGGAAAVTVANTFVGMQIDIERRTAILGNTIGGVSGPAIKPMALYLVYTVAQAVGIPVIGCGGICSTSDALEFLMAGAAAIQVGTATFGRPETMIQIIDQLPEAFAAHNETTAAHFTGSLVAAA